MDAIVVGAGFAGLSAAARLASHGVRVTVLEARPQPGGRATAFRDPASGEWVDNGQHLMLGCYRETLAFLEAIGARNRLSVQPRLDVAMIDERGRISTLSCPALPSPFHLLAGILDWDALALGDRLAAFRLLNAIRLAVGEMRGVERRAASPGETVENWLIRNGQTGRLRDMLWNPLAIAALNQEPARAAAPYFSRVLAEMLAAGPGGASIAIPQVPLRDLYVEPARAFLEARGSHVVTRARAKVVLSGERVASVRTPAQSYSADAVIVAVPWHALPSAFEGDVSPIAPLLDAAARTPPSPIVTVNLWVKGGPLPVPFVGLPGRTIQWVFDKRALFGSGAQHLSLVASAASHIDGWSNDAIVDLAVDELCSAIPDVREFELTRANVVRERRATFSLAPGQPCRPGVRTAVPGLLLGGDWIDTGLPGTIESAVRSGHAAADEALRRRLAP